MINFTTPLWLFVILMLTLVISGLMSSTYKEGATNKKKASSLCPTCPADLTSELDAANSSYAAYKIQAEEEKVSALNSANTQCTNEKQVITDEYTSELNNANATYTSEKQALIDTAESAMSEATNNWTNERQSMLDSAESAMNKANKEYKNEISRQVNVAANNLAVANEKWTDANNKLSKQITNLQEQLAAITSARDKCFIDRDKLQGQYKTCDADRTGLQTSFTKCYNDRTGLNADVANLTKMLADLHAEKDNLMRTYNFDCFPKSVAKNRINALETQLKTANVKSSSDSIISEYSKDTNFDETAKIDKVYTPVAGGGTPCPSGKYNSSTGETPCTDCEAGTYASNDYNFVCNKCPTGTTSQRGATKCVSNKSPTPHSKDRYTRTHKKTVVSGFSNMYSSFESYNSDMFTFSKY